MNKEQKQKIKRAYQKWVLGCENGVSVSIGEVEMILKELGENSIEYMLYELGREDERRESVFAPDQDGFLG